MATETNTIVDIKKVCNEVAELLITKNASYGNSALDPIRIFSKLDSIEGLKIRIDDKLSRLLRGQGDFGEDTELDLMGYLVLLRVARLRRAMKRDPTQEVDLSHLDDY